MPRGQRINPDIQPEQVTIAPGGMSAPAFDDDAAATIVMANYEKCKAYLETNSWLLEWQASDILYQSPNNDRWTRVADGRPVRINRFLVAKNVNTMAEQIHKAIWGNKKPFALDGENKTTELHLESWTHLLWVLMKRAKAEYAFGLANETACLQGTGILQPGWEEKTYIKKRRKRAHPEPQTTPAIGESQSIPTEESDKFEIVKEEVTESWPFLELRRLGTTLFDDKWSTPNAPEESAGFVIDVDYLNFQDLQQLRKLSCYKNLPNDETLKEFFFRRPPGDAAPASMVADTMTSQSSVVMHAAGEQRQIDADPTKAVLMLVTQWDAERVQAVLCYEGEKLTIRNAEHDLGDHALHYAMNWWNIPNNGYGMGIGRLNSSDQRMEQGVLNEVLKMIGMWFNTPLMIRRGENAPTQNVVAGLGTFWAVDTPPDGDVRKAAMYADKPQIPPDAWRVYQESKQGGEDLVGANSTTMQGNLGGPGSSAMRTATGVNRVGGKADENVAKPVRHQSWSLERFIYFLIDMVRLKMPLQEIRDILAKKYSDEIIKEIDLEDFLNAEFTVDVFAGAKLALMQAIQQLIPFLLQIVQQPQILEGLHQTGRTVDYEDIESLFVRMSALDGDEFEIFREMTPKEAATYKQNNPGAQKVMGQLAVEQERGKNRLAETQVKGQQDLVTKLAVVGAEHNAGAVPLERAEGLVERREDVSALQNGVGNQMSE
jgi:hypothetical protein